MNLNKVFLIGRVAADPEVRTTPSGQQVATLRLATNRVWNNRTTNEKQEQVEFHTVVTWGRLAEITQKYLQKGQLVFFEGRLQTRSWQGADGVKRYRTEIVAENLQLGPKARPASPEFQRGEAGQASGGREEQFTAQASPRTPAPFPKVPDEEIPIIDESSPVSNPIISDSEVEESEIDLKDIPF